jgi:lipoyl(octanoyl) transferase
VAWAEARAGQEVAWQAVRDGGPDTLHLLEHPPVITTGRRAVPLDEEAVRAAGFELHQADRGGLATCHEPGQLVGYLFVDVRTIGVRPFVHAVEDGLIRWLASQGVRGDRWPGRPGVWVGETKVAAIGLGVRRGVTCHGFALNLANDLAGFSLIDPCGLGSGSVGSLARLVPRSPTPEEAAPSVAVTVLDALPPGV